MNVRALPGAAWRDRWSMTVEAKALFVVTAILLSLGLVVLHSASAVAAGRSDDGSAFFLFRQSQGVLAGAVLFAFAAKVDAELWSKWAWPLIGVAFGTMLLIVIPGVPGWIAPTILGSNRFLSVPGVGTVQPSEFAKLAVIVWTAMLVVKKGTVLRRLLKGVSPFLVVVGGLALLAALEPDVSIAVTFLLITGVILFASGARIGHFLFLGVLSAPVLVAWLSSHAYVLRRFDAILSPGGGIDSLSAQLKQSLIAVGSGGLLGQGYGQGIQQVGWVPMGNTDFIGSVLGEEWGFVGMLFVIGMFSLYGWLGFRIADQARTRFQQLVAIGITFTMLFTAFVHIGVVTGLLPTTGLTLPFFSYGRSNLLLSLTMTGILVNIGSNRERVIGEVVVDQDASSSAEKTGVERLAVAGAT
jgi:cell division protein FtsW